ARRHFEAEIHRLLGCSRIMAIAVAAGCGRIETRKGDDADTVEAGQGHIADCRRHLPRKIELARLAKGHRFTGIEKNSNRKFTLFLIKFEKKSFEPPVKVPIEITKIVPMNVIAVIGKLDRLS